VNRLFFTPLLFTFTLASACKSLPPPAENVPETPAAETYPAVSGGTDDAETPQFTRRAEETVAPLDTPVDAALIEPAYDMSAPEVADLEREPGPLAEDGWPVVLDEAVERLPAAESVPPPLVEETAPPSAVETETEPAAPSPEEAASRQAEEALAEAEEESPPPAPPPPPPAAALRRAELAAAPPPAAKTRPAEPQLELPARNPPVETAGAAKPAANRTIRVNTGQLFEIPFQGTGWVYTGEENSKSGVNYNSRRAGGGTLTFTFRAEKEGDYTLKFYKQDFLQDYYTNEYVHVIVEDGRAASTAESPSAQSDTGEALAGGPSAAPPPPEAAGGGATSGGDAVSGPPGDLLRRAREAVSAEKYGEAIALLDRLRDIQPAMNDEAWWLYGQAFEAASPDRDIRSALDAYYSLIRDYPQSRYYQDARNRIALLNRFYFNIR
jgi:hypothetical protein